MNVYVAIPVKEEEKKELTGAFPSCKFVFGGEIPGNTSIVFGNIETSELCKINDLKWLQTNSAGTEPYMKDGILPKGCILTNATGGYGLAISEHMLSMHLALIKKIHLYRDLQRGSDWQDLGPVTTVKNSTVLVIGLGDIGTDYAKLVKGMGAYVIGVRRADSSPCEFADEVHLAGELDSLLSRADIVAIALPGTAATSKMLDKKRIALMKKGAVILNVGRGTVIDTEALCDALESGKLGGAGLDVTDPEPLPGNHRLWKIPSAIITPHISGGFHLDETRQRIIGIFADNLRLFLEGEALNNIVDFETGYRRSKSV